MIEKLFRFAYYISTAVLFCCVSFTALAQEDRPWIHPQKLTQDKKPPNPTIYLALTFENETGIYVDIPAGYENVPWGKYDNNAPAIFHLDTITHIDTKLLNFVPRFIDLKDTFYVYDSKGLLGTYRFANYAYKANVAGGGAYWYLNLVPMKKLKRNPQNKDLLPLAVVPSSSEILPLTVGPTRKFEEVINSDGYDTITCREYRLQNIKQNTEIIFLEKDFESTITILKIFQKGKEIYRLQGDSFGC